MGFNESDNPAPGTNGTHPTGSGTELPSDDSSDADDAIPYTQPRTTAVTGFQRFADRAGDTMAPPVGEANDGSTLEPNGHQPVEDTADAPEFATIPELAPLIAGMADVIETEPQPPAPDFDRPPPGGGGGGGGRRNGRSGRMPDDDPNAPPHDKELDLMGHLVELRARILHSLYAIVIGMIVTWNLGKYIQAFFMAPIQLALKRYGHTGSSLVILTPTEGFMLYFQISMIAAILLVMPYILWQLWAFIEPALTRRERRFTVILVPFSVLLFIAGLALGYVMSPLFYQFFLQFQPPDSKATLAVGATAAFQGKMLLVFGICFQVPVVTIFLNKTGLVSRNLLLEYWRHVVVVIFVVVAIITPTWDPVTLIVCSIPPCLLYGLSLWMVKWL
jgi:sec-independent protein translocase protein TatC